MTVICPKCNALAIPTETKFGIRHDHCGLWSWGNAPLVDAVTHAARMLAHDAFDRLWHSNRISRGEAYRLLAIELAIPARDCHIKKMDRATATRTLAAVARISERLP